MDTNKFSILLDEIALYNELDKLVWYMAWNRASDSDVLTSPDELAAELYLEIAKGLDHYREKGLTKAAIKNVIKMMMNHRLSEIIYRFYVTHRKAAVGIASLESDSEIESFASDVPNPEHSYIAKETLDDIKSELDANAIKVLDCIIYNQELGKLMIAAGDTKDSVKPVHVALVLGMEEREVKRCFSKIRRVWSKTYNG